MRLLVVLIVLGIALSPVVLVVPLLGLGQQRSVYATRADAVADGAIQRGWVPEFVPADATDIREAHNVEHAFVTVSFRAPGARVVEGFRPVAAAHQVEAMQMIRSVRFPGARPGRDVSITYRCEQDGVGLLAHDLRRQRYFFAGPFPHTSLCVAH